MKKNDSGKLLAQALLANKITESRFEELKIKRDGEGLSVSFDGQVFGFIGAMGVAIKNLSEEAEMPLDILLEYINLAAETACEATQRCGDTVDTLYELFNKCFDKEDN